MAWYVIARDPDGKEHRVLCEDPKKVSDTFLEQRRAGRKVRIEEAGGKEVAAAQFGIDKPA